jgi:non-heme Fe2+,alpha-ketoglutarate-dependent halogenase
MHGARACLPPACAHDSRAAPVSEGELAKDVLRPGEFSLHHIRLAHRSPANVAAHRRIGMAVRYMPTSCRCVLRDGVGVMLARGLDEYHLRVVIVMIGTLD